jgi:predicted PurR-regulated permease PerM
VSSLTLTIVALRFSAYVSSDPTNTLRAEIRSSQVTFKTVFTIASGVILVAAVVAMVASSLVAIGLVGAALLIAITLEHAVRMLQRHGFRRSLAILTVMLFGLGVAAGFGFLLVPPAVTQGQQLVHNAPRFLHTVRESKIFLSIDERFHVALRLQQLEKQLPEMMEGAAAPILKAVGGVLKVVGALVTITVLVIFLLVFGNPLIDAALAEARAERRAIYNSMLGKIYQSTGGYLGGLLLIGLINATLTTTFLAINHVPSFLPLGILSGLSSLIPYAGPITAGTATSLIVLLTGGVWHGLASAIYFSVYGEVEGNLLGPLIFRRTVDINPLIVILSILFFGDIAGIAGAIVAVPVVATLQIIVREVLRIRREELALTSSVTTDQGSRDEGSGDSDREITRRCPFGSGLAVLRTGGTGDAGVPTEAHDLL